MKIKNRINFTLDYLLKRRKVKCMPIELDVELTNICTSRCLMCPNYSEEIKRGYMEFSTFKKIVDEVKDYAEMFFVHLSGESLLHPKVFDMVKYCKSQGVPVGFSTNGILLDKEASKKLIETNLDYLTISINAFFNDTYKKVMGVDKRDIVYENVINFLKMNNKKIYTSIQLIQLKENQNELKEFKKFWNGKKADVVRIKPSISFGGYYTKGSNIKRLKPCVLLWRMMVVHWNGDASLCCLDLLNKHPIGNVNKNSIREIWNSDKMQRYRELHIKGLFDNINICKVCNVPNINIPLLLGGAFLDTFTIKKLIVKLENKPYFKNYV